MPRTTLPTARIERVAAWSVRHRWWAIGGWFALVVLAVLAGAAVTGDGAPAHDPGESGRAQRVLDAQHGYSPAQESVLVTSGHRYDGVARAAADDLIGTLRRSGAVTGLADRARVSADGTAGLVTFQLAGPEERAGDHFDATVRVVREVGARHPGVRLAQAGDRSLSAAVDDSITADFGRAETISLPLTVVVLLIVFGSLVAAGIPVLLTLTTVAATFSLLTVVDQWIPINSAASSMVLLIGVAVGVDYSLFYLRRAREERAAGRDTATAVRTAAATSGRVVIVAGLTVLLCLCGLLLAGIDQFRGLTVGTAVAVGLAVLGSCTVLPALLALLGRHVDAVRIPVLRKRSDGSRVWSAIARAVVRRPAVAGGLAAVALAVLALPAFGLHLQDAAVTDSLPRSVPQVDAALRMQRAFPGAAAPARVVVWARDGGTADTPEVRRAVGALRARIPHSHGLLADPVTVVRVGRALVVRVPLAGSGTDPTSNRALAELRGTALPATLGRVGGVGWAVQGRTAFAYDFARTLAGRVPYVVGFVLVLAFVLLAWAFRSLVIPVVSIVLNLLSVGAALGVLTWVFQDGHLSGPLGFTAYGGVVSWLPLFDFVLLFGLSMDYHVFVLSRIRERVTAGVPPRAAIVDGVGRSAGVVSSAALLMTAVFAVFVVLTAIEYKMLGVGMAVAVLLDATVVRGVLLPAALALVGRRAWGRRAPAPAPPVRVGAGAS
ncbi:MMPL family transporter [Actinocatenispora rupis]|uniref:Exporter n=1 Tax=Actinocatenispora rupis TaxID=519421 RepID=A0A8J3NCX6_9ACTN|nr:MMPL family transporter [Actinocatenispora rupis]GID10919.1 exporter [Actinocatenispora rupis]